MNEDPVFKEIDVSNFSVQLRKDRYPDPDGFFINSTAPNILENADWTDDGGETTETYSGPPHIARWRMNLTALSQKHNLYFVASRDKIHCFVPRDLKQTLPSTPDIIVCLHQSEPGHHVGGYLDPIHPHSVNHMIVGNLGDMEILFMACDDGDVYAFYTHVLQHETRRPDINTKVRDVKPFFHQNVGISAWGLAIHQRSRLLAVSSNRREISIFVPAVSDELSDDETTEYERSEFLPLPGSTAFPNRKKDLTHVISVNIKEANIPAINFVNGVDEEVEWIMAANIKGFAFLVDPRDGSRIDIEGYHPRANRESTMHMAWGVLPLSLTDFKLTSTIHETLGFKINEDNVKSIIVKDGKTKETYLNVGPPRTRSMQLIRHGFRGKPKPNFEYVEDSDSGKREYTECRSRKGEKSVDRYSPESNTELFWVLLRLPQCMRSEVVSWQTLTHRVNALSRLDREGILLLITPPEKPRRILNSLDQLIFLRTYAHDIELVTHTSSIEKRINTRLVDPLMENMPDQGIARMNMLFPIPELSVVVVASQSGRVCVLTLTKLEDQEGTLDPFVSFRLDHILPFLKQKQAFKPDCPLLGMAVSPLQKSNTSNIKGVGRRWRLILHYYDQTILSYELGRNENGLLVL